MEFGRASERFWPTHVADEARFDSRGECFAAPASAAMRTRTGVAAGDARGGAMGAPRYRPKIQKSDGRSKTAPCGRRWSAGDGEKMMTFKNSRWWPGWNQTTDTRIFGPGPRFETVTASTG